MKKDPIILIIRDGWGYNPKETSNAIVEGNTPHTDSLMKEYPNMLIDAAGPAVGLPEGYQGNSEVGHITIGSGRIINQSLARINKSIETGEFHKNEVFLSAIQNAKDNSSTLHLIGLLQTEGVHAHMDHLFALLDICKKEDFKKVAIHIITDGRDAPPTVGIKKIQLLLEKIESLGFGEIVTVTGRYYSMDRNKTWDRTQKAYDCIVNSEGEEFTDILQHMKKNYESDTTDEFIIPAKKTNYEGLKENDSMIFYNFRTDRTRQLTQAIVEPEFDGWDRELLKIHFVGMTQYYKPMNAHVAFSNISLTNLLGEIISDNDLNQLRISETEKYAHVTFFFNGQIEEPYKNEDRILIQSPKVATYDLKPEMSAYEITDRIVQELDRDYYDLIVVNLVNGDMVGHTGVKEACLKAVETVDDCVGKLTTKILEKNGTALVFADHGNVEDLSPAWGTSHTINQIPFILVSPEGKNITLKESGGLRDIAPTVLDILGIKKPEEMTGESFIISHED